MTKTTKKDLLVIFNRFYPKLTEGQKRRILSLFYAFEECCNGKNFNDTTIEVYSLQISKILKMRKDSK